jgi:hypothetical protein
MGEINERHSPVLKHQAKGQLCLPQLLSFYRDSHQAIQIPQRQGFLALAFHTCKNPLE